MKILVYGSRDYARLVRDLAEICGHEFAGYIDDLGEAEAAVGTFESVSAGYPPASYGIVLGIGYNDLPARARAIERVKAAGYAMPTLVHPRAYVRDERSIAGGAIIMAQAAVERNAAVGECSVLWTGAVLSHDSRVGPNSFLSPNCTICGFVTIGRDCFIGAGATIVEHCGVPDGSFVKAGTVFL